MEVRRKIAGWFISYKGKILYYNSWMMITRDSPIFYWKPPVVCHQSFGGIARKWLGFSRSHGMPTKPIWMWVKMEDRTVMGTTDGN